MKKFNRWLKGLSLSQQLFALIFFFITFFASFFFIYLSGNIDLFIRDQMYGMITRSQNSVIFGVTNGVSVNKIFINEQQDKSVTHLYFADNSLKTFTTNNLAYFTNRGDLIKNITANIKKMDKQSARYQFGERNNYTYYIITKVPEGGVIVSMTDNSYISEFKDTLLSSIINITVLVVGVFFIILMIWVAYLIHPLNQIKNYIEKIKLGKDATLNVNRNDEIGELAEAIISMRQELKKQEKTKEEMIHNISHDLKTPIATIKSYAESIKDGVYPYDTLEKSVDVIIDNAERLEKKVQSLLWLNRVEYLISQERHDEKVNMKEIINKVMLAIKVINPEIEIESHLEEIYFDGSEEPWRVTIENIIENALRYAKTHIIITLNKDELSIENDGQSMSEERINSLFKPFEKGKEGKFGLGLSIVYKVVSANGYRVYGENTSEGVIFRITKN
ncbi:MAG: HAMP domain-containing sensor histidine kinase [Erysipelotrichaceae bacterium]